MTEPIPSEHGPASHTDALFSRSPSFFRRETVFPACNLGGLWSWDFTGDRHGRYVLEKEKSMNEFSVHIDNSNSLNFTPVILIFVSLFL